MDGRTPPPIMKVKADQPKEKLSSFVYGKLSGHSQVLKQEYRRGVHHHYAVWSGARILNLMNRYPDQVKFQEEILP